MAAYKVFLVDILDTIGGPDRKNEVTAMLQGYFAKIATKAKIDDGASVQFVDANPQAASNELICYFSPGRHVVTLMDNSEDTASNGLTNRGHHETGSDVRVNSLVTTRKISNLVFHELMHNKTALKDEALHKLGGLAAESIDDTTALTDDNIALMATNLKKSRPQRVGGFGFLLAKKNGDPLSDL